MAQLESVQDSLKELTLAQDFATRASDPDATPLMKQYWDLKSQAPDALLLFRMGDFYELFGDDAVEAARILEITLTSRDKGKENPMPMAGVPHHSAQSYIQGLLDAGKKIAIGEQTEDPEEAKKRGSKSIVRREIVRILTPAVQFDGEGSERAYLATAVRITPTTGATRYTLALLEPSTGESRLSLPLDEKALLDELASLPIRHFLRIGHDLPERVMLSLQGRSDVLLEDLPSNRLSQGDADALIRVQFGVQSLEPFLEKASDLASSTHALGFLVQYLQRSQKTDQLTHLRTPKALRETGSMALGPRTLEHLDIFSEGAPSLFARLNRTRSALGARELRSWIASPLKHLPEIERRQSALRELASDRRRIQSLQKVFSESYDLERILGRITTRLANPRDTLALGKTLAQIPRTLEALSGLNSSLLSELRQSLETATRDTEALSSEILRIQREDAPFHAREGNVFGKGTDPELDRLIDLTENGQRWLIDLELREREATGIPTLKVRYNRVFGYYIEVTAAHLKSVPAHYQRKQTTVGAERFFTEELKRFEDEIVSAGDRKKALEAELFQKLVDRIQLHSRPVSEAALGIARLDALCALSELVNEAGWVFPVLDESLDLDIEAGRHPLVDQGRGNFVPNDLHLDQARCTTLLITGPNMGGKSTLMRQIAVIVWLGQMGAPVPAARARWGVVSSIYTRIGAHDAIARGQSTFMVEMTELAHLLHHADSRSLVVLDEIGRGTSTYDGISVAWATLEWMVKNLGCRTLFATHYHELTKLPHFLPKVGNAHMAVESARGTLRFLYRLEAGATNESFGVQVAKLAGLPAPVIQRAWKVLTELENGAKAEQPSLFSAGEAAFQESDRESLNDLPPAAESNPEKEELLLKLSGIDLNAMNPLQALNCLNELQLRAKALT